MPKIDITKVFDWEKESHSKESQSEKSTDSSTDSTETTDSSSSVLSKAYLFLKSVRAHRPTFEELQKQIEKEKAEREALEKQQ